MNNHQLEQIKVIDSIAEQVKQNSLQFSTVAPVADLENDNRICLTGVHLPHPELLNQIQRELITPLRLIEPSCYYYDNDSLHTTIKNIRVISYPPNFGESEIAKAKEVFGRVIERHRKFKVNYYRLLLFPNSLSLMGTTDPELDEIIFDLNRELTKAGIPDDKVYANSKYFFSNMTLCRFSTPPSKEFKAKVGELSDSINFKPYLVDSVTLLSGNAAMNRRKFFGTWRLV